MLGQKYWHHRVSLVNSVRFEPYTWWPWKVIFKIWSQVKVTVKVKVTQVCHVSYGSMRLDQTNTVVPFSFLISTLSKVIGKKPSLTPVWPQMTLWEVIGQQLHMVHQKFVKGLFGFYWVYLVFPCMLQTYHFEKNQNFEIFFILFWKI